MAVFVRRIPLAALTIVSNLRPIDSKQAELVWGIALSTKIQDYQPRPDTLGPIMNVVFNDNSETALFESMTMNLTYDAGRAVAASRKLLQYNESGNLCTIFGLMWNFKTMLIIPETHYDAQSGLTSFSFNNRSVALIGRSVNISCAFCCKPVKHVGTQLWVVIVIVIVSLLLVIVPVILCFKYYRKYKQNRSAVKVGMKSEAELVMMFKIM
jgi:hypothetical protein